MRRCARTALAAAVVVIGVVIGGGGGCECTAATRCTSDAECPLATTCTNGACAIPPATATRIDSIDGEGTESAPTPSPEAPPDAQPAAHRIRDTIVVRGVALDVVTSARLIDNGGGAAGDLEIIDTSSDGATMHLRLPADLRAGFFTLVLAASTTATEARADVFLLQGEAGPPTLVVPRDGAPTPTCTNGGVHYAAGVDVNRNGVLDPSEEDGALARDVCNGADGAGTGDFVCAGGTCTTSSTIVAPRFEIDGRPVAAHVPVGDAVTVLVPGDADTLSGALALFDGVTIDGAVEILVSGVVDEPANVNIDRADFLHVKVSGATADAALHFSGPHGVVVARGALGSVSAIALVGDDDVEGVGFLVEDHGFIGLGAGVDVSHFNVGFFAVRAGQAVLVAPLLHDNRTGLVVSSGSYVNADGLRVVDNIDFGVFADRSSGVDMPSAVVDGNGTGINATNGSTVIASTCAVRNTLRLGVNAENQASVNVTACTFSANGGGDIRAAVGSVVRDDDANATSKTALFGSVIQP